MRAEKRRAGRRIRKQRRIFRRASEAFQVVGLSANRAARDIEEMFTQFSEALKREEQDRG